jgi:hypothetical protein
MVGFGISGVEAADFNNIKISYWLCMDKFVSPVLRRGVKNLWNYIR